MSGATSTMAAGIRPGSPQAWILAARPATLTVAVVPVIVGTAVASVTGGVAKWPAIAALLGAIWIQIGTNFANDVFDYEKGADTAERLGPTRATQAGLLMPRQTRFGMILSFVFATIAGAYLVSVGGWPVVAIGVFSIASGIAYTGGPFPLGYNGLGDVFVMLFFGFVAVCGTVYVQTLTVPSLAWLASIPVGAIATAVLVVNNTRDFEQDRKVGKKTLVARFGRPFGIAEYAVLLVVAWLVPVVIWLSGHSLYVMLPLFAAPLGVQLAFAVSRKSGAELNPLLGRTAQLLLAYGGLFACGIALG